VIAALLLALVLVVHYRGILYRIREGIDRDPFWDNL
jgi:hypothetical protein